MQRLAGYDAYITKGGSMFEEDNTLDNLENKVREGEGRLEEKIDDARDGFQEKLDDLGDGDNDPGIG
jgi:hypothetical protein